MSGFQVNSIWSVLGLPLGLLSYLYHLYSRRQKENLKDKVVFITGASSGLGEACAEVFYDAGCKLILSGRRSDKLGQLKEKLIAKKIPGSSSPAIVMIDLENLESIPGKVAQALSAFGRIDILVNNAGMSYRGKVADTKLDVDKKLMVVNYFAQVELTKAILPHMVKQNSGQIVAISSVQGLIAIPHRSAYAASKHALQSFCDSLRAEMFGHNIHVCVVSPYYIQTNLSLNALTGDGEAYGKMDMNTKVGLKPDYVARKVLDCVEHRTDELTLAPLHVRLAVALRTLAPWLFFKLMASRARKEHANMIKDK